MARELQAGTLMIRKEHRLLAIEIIAPLVVIGAWYLLSANSTSLYFPPLSKILVRFKQLWLGHGFITEAVPSLVRMIIGYVLAAAGGIAIGVALGLSAWARRLMGSGVEFLRALPAVVMIPFGLVVFGTGATMKIFIIALGCCFPIILNTADGVRGVDSTLVDVSRTFKFNRFERIWRVVLPSASPQIFAGLRTSLSLALILMVVSEMLAATNGIGYSILQAQRDFAVTDVWAGIVLLGILGYLINAVLVIAQHLTLGWHRGYRASMRGETVKARRRLFAPSTSSVSTAGDDPMHNG